MKLRIVFIIAGFTLLVNTVSAQTADPLFEGTQPLSISLSAPFGKIDIERDKEQSYDGTLSYLDSAGSTVVLNAKFSVRGNWRLQKSNCGHAPLWLDLRKKQVEGTLFENQNRLKLVVQCGNQTRHEQWVLKEKMAYDLFAAVSPINFDSRLLEVTYIDTEQEDEERTETAFFIEHQNRVAERFELEKTELHRVGVDALDARQSNLVTLFMFMIGNTDFALTSGAPNEECCHNAKLLSNAEGVYFPVPYDFDSSGLVDAAYASPPNEAMRISNNKQRRFRGYCSHEESLPEEIAYFISLEADILALAASQQGLTDRTRRIANGYLEDYFKLLRSERNVKRQILGRCR